MQSISNPPRGAHPHGAFYVIGRTFVLRKKRHSATSIHYTCTYPLRQVRTFFLSLAHPKSPLPCPASLSHSQLPSPMPSFPLPFPASLSHSQLLSHYQAFPLPHTNFPLSHAGTFSGMHRVLLACFLIFRYNILCTIYERHGMIYE